MHFTMHLHSTIFKLIHMMLSIDIKPVPNLHSTILKLILELYDLYIDDGYTFTFHYT